MPLLLLESTWLLQARDRQDQAGRELRQEMLTCLELAGTPTETRHMAQGTHSHSA